MGWSRSSLALAAGLLALALLAGPAGAQDAAQPDGEDAESGAPKLTGDNPQEQYRSALEQIAALRVYNEQMQELIAAQQAELASLNEQVGQVEVVKRSIPELLIKMVDALERFVELDMPFNLEERQKRVADLRRALLDAEIQDAERYRRIMEAYTIENEFGRTYDAYSGSVEKPNGETLPVYFLRFGRIALIYQTLDESEAGTWDQATRSWVPLGDEYTSSIRQALRMARKQAAPDLVNLPLPAATESPS